MRLVGPNCMGVVNTAPDVSLTATFARADVPAGTIGFVSQSGAFGAAAIDGAVAARARPAAFVSLGDKADLSSNDLLQYWEQDPATQVVALYLESFGNPRKFGRVARRVARAKPVLAVKAGRTSAGARAASSHTGALIAADDSTVDALFAAAGRDPLRRPRRPARRRRGVRRAAAAARWSRRDRVQRARARVVCADACEDAGLEVAETVQLAASAGPLRSGRAGRRGPGMDAVIAIYVEHIAIAADSVAEALAAVTLDVPLLAVFMTPGELPTVLRAAGRRVSDSHGRKIPTFRAPERAARALGRARPRTRAGRRRHRGGPALDVDADTAAAVLASALAQGGGWLRPDEVETLLGAYGISLVEQRRVSSVAAAAKAAAELGGPVALKGVAPGVVHKAQAGAVALGLSGPTAVRRAATEIAARLEAAGTPAAGLPGPADGGRGRRDARGRARRRAFRPGRRVWRGRRHRRGARRRRGPAGAARPRGGARHDRLAALGGIARACRWRHRGARGHRRPGRALADAHPAIAELDLNPVMVRRTAHRWSTRACA